MAIDLAAIRKKLNQLSGQNSKKNAMWRPEEGSETTVRLIAYPNNDGQPFKELMFYYNIPGQRGLLAPSQFGERDPVQELINKLRDEGTKESYEMAKKLYPKMRVYAAVVVRGEEDKGVQLWGFGKLVYQKLLGIMLDEDYGDITDPKSGRDIKVICSKPPGQQWAKTEILPRGRSTKLSDDTKQAKEWMTNIPDTKGIFKTKSYDELSKIVNDWLNGDNEDDEGTEKFGSNKSDSDDTPKSGGGGKSYNDLDDAFADLMS